MMVREEPRRFDISAIDFDLLRKEFAKVHKKNLVMKDLEEVIQQKLDKMLFSNPNRINYYERYQQIMDRWKALKSELKERGDEVRAAYKEAQPYLTSTEFWEKYLGLDEADEL